MVWRGRRAAVGRSLGWGAGGAAAWTVKRRMQLGYWMRSEVGCLEMESCGGAVGCGSMTRILALSVLVLAHGVEKSTLRPSGWSRVLTMVEMR